MKRMGKRLLAGLLIAAALALTACAPGGNGKLPVESLRSAEDVSMFEHGTAVVRLADGKMCVIDAQGNLIIPPVWDYVEQSYIPGMYRVAKGAPGTPEQKWGAVDSTGRIVIPVEWDGIQGYDSEPVRWEAEVGSYSDPDYRIVYFTGDGKRLDWDENNSTWTRGGRQISRRNGKYGLLSPDGKELAAHQYDEMKYFAHDGASMYAVSRNGLWGFINADGREIVPCSYRRMSVGTNQIWALSDDDQVLRLNADGSVRFNMTANVADLNRGIRADHLELEIEWSRNLYTADISFLDNQNVAYVYVSVYDTRGQRTLIGSTRAFVRENGSFVVSGIGSGYLTSGGVVWSGAPGEIIVQYTPFEWNSARRSYSAQYDEASVVVIDEDGSPVVRPGQYDDIFFYDGLGVYICRDLNGLYGLVGLKGRVILPAHYEYMHTYWESADELLLVRKSGRYGYIDKGGNVVIPLRWEYARDFNGGYAPARDAEGWKIIDVTGEVVY